MCMYVCMHVPVCMCVCACMHVCVCVCMHMLAVDFLQGRSGHISLQEHHQQLESSSNGTPFSSSRKSLQQDGRVYAFLGQFQLHVEE